MNIFRRLGMRLVHTPNVLLSPVSHHHFLTISIALRHFSQNNAQNPSLRPLYPLHDAVDQGNVERVKQILRTDIAAVNGLNAEGELPLGIAAQKYLRKKGYPAEMLKLLYDYGACYLLDDGKGKAPLEYMAKKTSPTHYVELGIRIDAARHSIAGCGLPIARCTNTCKKESQEYSAEFKAKISLESLSTSLTIDQLARKHRIEPWEIIKWRWQAREGLVKLFTQEPPTKSSESVTLEERLLAKEKELGIADLTLEDKIIRLSEIFPDSQTPSPKASLGEWIKHFEEVVIPELAGEPHFSKK